MYKIHLPTLIPKKDKDKFTKSVKSLKTSKRDLFEAALHGFKQQVNNNKQYIFKYQDYDRINDVLYSISLFEDTYEEIKSLSRKLGASQRGLVREIIFTFNRTKS